MNKSRINAKPNPNILIEDEIFNLLCSKMLPQNSHSNELFPITLIQAKNILEHLLLKIENISMNQPLIQSNENNILYKYTIITEYGEFNIFHTEKFTESLFHLIINVAKDNYSLTHTLDNHMIDTPDIFLSKRYGFQTFETMRQKYFNDSKPIKIIPINF